MFRVGNVCSVCVCRLFYSETSVLKMKMCTFLCLKALKVIQNVCKRNLHLIKLGNLDICSFRTAANNRKANLLCLNMPVRYYSVNVNAGAQKEIENKLDEENCTDLYSNVDYDTITGGDDKLLKKLKILMLEVEVMIQEGNKVPSKLKTSDWKELLLLETRTARKKLLHFLFIKEVKKNNGAEKKAQKKLKIEEERIEQDHENEKNNHIKYGFGGNTIFLRIYPTTIDNFYNRRLIRAMQFGQNLVVDCSYDSHMSVMEANNCAKQIMFMFADNRVHDNPYNLHFCKADPKSTTFQKLQKSIPTMYDPAFPMNITEKSYLDIFPKDKLVYLTPHCRNELNTFSHDDIYIIGAMVDKANSEPLSLAKAKSEGLRMACLPLDKHLLWHIGSKRLALNQVLLIMLDIKKTGSWTEAFKHVPKRKLIERPERKRKLPFKTIWDFKN